MAIAINELGTWRRRALIVDDSRLAAAMLRRMLERQGFEVEWVGSPGAALGRLRYDRPDLIFLDHWMEGLCGLDVLSLIKSNPATAGVPVVMFTSMESVQYNEDALASGASAVLPKRADGIDMPQLLERLGMLSLSTPLALEPRRAIAAASVTALPLHEPAKAAITAGRDTGPAPSPLRGPGASRDRPDWQLRNGLIVRLRQAAWLWRRTLIGVGIAVVLAIATALIVVALLGDAGRASDELALRDRAIAAASSPVATARLADVLHEGGFESQ